MLTDARVRLPARARSFAVGSLGLIALGTVWVAARGAQSFDAPATGCNGAAELCDRRYDEVAYVATHNSMSSPRVVRIWPEHDSFLRGQLDAGVRALLIDTHYWPPVTSAGLVTPSTPATGAADGGGRGGVRGSRHAGRQPSGTFLCHNHCAFGGVEASTGLTEVSSSRTTA